MKPVRTTVVCAALLFFLTAGTAHSAGEKYRTARVLKVGTDSRRVLLDVELQRKNGERFSGLVVSAPEGNTVVARGDDVEFVDAERNLKKVAFRTSANLGEADNDRQKDIYIWTRPRLRLFPANKNLSEEPEFVSMSDNGTRYAFATRDQLVDDVDQATDVYLLDPSGIQLASPGTSLDARPYPVLGVDSSAVFFTTTEQLLPEDVDGGSSLYWGNGDEIKMISAVDVTETPFYVQLDPKPFAGSPTGARIILTTKRRLLPADLDDYQDIYSWDVEKGLTFRTPGATEDSVELAPQVSRFRTAVSDDARSFLFTSWNLISPFRTGMPLYLSDYRGIRNYPSFRSATSAYAGSTPNLGYVFLAAATHEVGPTNLYRVSSEDGTTTRMTRAIPGVRFPEEYRVRWVAGSGGTVIFSTGTRLLKGDRDRREDLYVWRGGKVTMLTRFQPRVKEATLGMYAIGPHGGDVYTRTKYQLIPSDRDQDIDIYRLNEDAIERVPLWPDS